MRAIILAFLLTGCASMDAIYDSSRWEFDGFQTATYTWKVVDNPSVCSFQQSMTGREWGCAVRVRDSTPQPGAKPVPGVDPSVGGHCYIFASVTEEDAKRITSIHGDNLRDHELRHCNAWNHPRR